MVDYIFNGNLLNTKTKGDTKTITGINTSRIITVEEMFEQILLVNTSLGTVTLTTPSAAEIIGYLGVRNVGNNFDWRIIKEVSANAISIQTTDPSNITFIGANITGSIRTYMVNIRTSTKVDIYI